MDTIHLTPRLRRSCALAAVLCLVGSGCSSDDEPVAKKVAQRSVVDQALPLDRVLVPRKALDAEKVGSVRRTFLMYWSLLQHQAVADVVDMIDPGLVAHIGADQIAEAFKAQAPYFRSVRPRITDVVSRGDTQTVFYNVKDIQGLETPRSVRWRRVDGDWAVIYDAFLDLAIRDAVQTATQTAIDPLASKPSRRALQAGSSAGTLQSTWLKQQLER